MSTRDLFGSDSDSDENTELHSPYTHGDEDVLDFENHHEDESSSRHDSPKNDFGSPVLSEQSNHEVEDVGEKDNAAPTQQDIFGEDIDVSSDEEPSTALGNRKGMVIGSINVNSLLLHVDEVRELIISKRFHILATNETKLDSTIADSLLGVEGYALHRRDRDRHGGGVAVYIRDSLKQHRRTDVPEEALKFVESSPENTTNNVNAAVHMAAIYDTLGLTQLIKDPNRETLNTSTLFDHIASTHPANIPEPGVLKVALSVNYAVYCVRKYLGTFKQQQKIVSARNMKTFDESSYFCDLSQVDWNLICRVTKSPITTRLHISFVALKKYFVRTYLNSLTPYFQMSIKSMNKLENGTCGSDFQKWINPGSTELQTVGNLALFLHDNTLVVLNEEDNTQTIQAEGDQVDEGVAIEIELPNVDASIGDEIYFVKLPNFLSIETKPFDPAYFEDEIDEDELQDEEGRSRLKLKVENTIRWRYHRDKENSDIKESNARVVRWSDGSLSLHMGNEIFDIFKMPIEGMQNHLFVQQGTGLQAKSVFKEKLTFRPHSTKSQTHLKMTMSIADRVSKSQKIRLIPVTERDPEAARQEMTKKEDERLRAQLRRESQQRRQREKSHSKGLTANYLESELYEDDEQELEDSLAAIKNRYKKDVKAGRLRNFKDVYSDEDSDSAERLSKAKIDDSSDEEGARIGKRKSIDDELNRKKKIVPKIIESDEESD
eukprot:gene3840-4379_t